MDPTKVCSKCAEPKPLGAFGVRKDAPDGHRGRCLECENAAKLAWEASRRDEGITEDPEHWCGVHPFGLPIEREAAEAMIRFGSLIAAAEYLGIEPRQLRARLHELQRRAASRGWSPGHDMTKGAPDGFRVKGVSTYYDGDGKVKGQWVKTTADTDDQYAKLLDAMSSIADTWKGKADPVPLKRGRFDEDMLSVVPMGDPHLGMYAWAKETGAHFDVEIAERNLVAAVDMLVELGPPSKHALLLSLGDFFHADNSNGTTTAGTRVDVDTRWARVLAIGIRTMRRCIDRMLQKHEIVDVIAEIGNHDKHTSLMLAICLSQFYEREPRVRVDLSPAKFHWYRFGKCLIGSTHSDTIKPKDMPAVMACDRARDWGETLYRQMYTGHVHHDRLIEYPGVIVESMRTLAPKDEWHTAQGYRSGQDMKLDVWDRRYGKIMRHTVGINQICENGNDTDNDKD